MAFRYWILSQTGLETASQRQQFLPGGLIQWNPGLSGNTGIREGKEQIPAS